MFHLYVDGERIYPDAGQSFDFISENRLFTDADSFSTEISFRLSAGPDPEAKANRNLFGFPDHLIAVSSNWERQAKMMIDGQIINGRLVATEVSRNMIKCQFLGGRSAENYKYYLADRYINELYIGLSKVFVNSTEAHDPRQKYSDPRYCWNPEPLEQEGSKLVKTTKPWVALQWINESSGIKQNSFETKTVNGGSLPAWASGTDYVSLQYYLIDVAKAICDETGIAYDFQEWEESPAKWLLICNSIPVAWDIGYYGRALPHWTVAEFFRNIEPILKGEFDTMENGTLRFRSLEKIVREAEPVVIANIDDSHTQSIDMEEQSAGYRGAQLIKYPEADHVLNSFYSCRWAMELWKGQYVNNFSSLADMLSWCQDLRPNAFTSPSEGQPIFVDDPELGFQGWFVAEKYSYRTPTKFENGQPVEWEEHFRARPLRINAFGPSVPDALRDKEDDDLDTFSIQCSPVCIEPTSRIMSLKPGSFNEPDYTNSAGSSGYLSYWAYSIIKKGEQEKNPQYYDRLWLAFWPPEGINGWQTLGTQPYTDGLRVGTNFTFDYRPEYSMEINKGPFMGIPGLATIDPTRKYTLKFASEVLPDVRGRFYIYGQEYACAKLTAHIDTGKGMERILTGEFYKVTNPTREDP